MTSRLLVDKLEGKTTSGTIQMPAGHIIQVVENTTSSTISTTSTSLGATGHIVSITPKFANSKLIISLFGGEQSYSGSEIIVGHINLYRQLTGGSYTDIGQICENTTSGNIYGMTHGSELVDTSHNTTSAINYQPYIKTGSGKTYYYNYQLACVLKVMEVAQ